MEVKAVIRVPDDLSATPTLTTVPYSIPLTLIIVDPCESTTLSAFSVDDMSTTVLALAKLQSLLTQKPTDSVSF